MGHDKTYLLPLSITVQIVLYPEPEVHVGFACLRGLW